MSTALLRENLPLVIVTVSLTIAVFVLFKEVRAAKDQAAIGARLAAAMQKHEEQQLMLQQTAAPADVEAKEEDDDAEDEKKKA